MTGPARLAPLAPVDAPAAKAPTAGLISLASAGSSPGARWQGGYAYRPEIPASSAKAQSTTTAEEGTNFGTGLPSESVATIPVLLRIDDSVSTFDFAVEHYQDRAKRIAEAYASQLLEHELWTGELARADSLPNRYLSNVSAIVVTGGDGVNLPSPQQGVALLMKALGDAGIGDGMIHASRADGIRLPDGWTTEFTLAQFGFVVVVGSGYPGTGPAGTGENWIYATGSVSVWLDDIDVVPDTYAEAVDRSANKATYYAQRFAAADFAGPVFACHVNAAS